MAAMSATDASSQHGPNDWLIDEMRALWSADPASVGHEWRVIFDNENGTRTASAPQARPLIETTASVVHPHPHSSDHPATTRSTISAQPSTTSRHAPATSQPGPGHTRATHNHGYGCAPTTNCRGSGGARRKQRPTHTPATSP